VSRSFFEEEVEPCSFIHVAIYRKVATCCHEIAGANDVTMFVNRKPGMPGHTNTAAEKSQVE